MGVLPFLQRINAKLVKELGMKMFDELHARLPIDDDYPAFQKALQTEVLVDESLTQDETLHSIYQELIRKKSEFTKEGMDEHKEENTATKGRCKYRSVCSKEKDHLASLFHSQCQLVNV